MTPRQIQIELRERGITQNQIARQLKVSETSISRIIHKKSISRHLMFAIADIIETPVREVFPEYFGLEEPTEEETGDEETADPEACAA